ncbi:hypothetical protein [Algoriphagus sanaruensis]|uniref:Potassium transporter KefB n=1 Tax=Algoriphagus sanaruensis TaxID=1727163 RepID=A0A142EMT7_9BACT|nr:hypothetical protein [Algoriphagus sanaruensis]AMQ56442.1 hypothetical protein AO498_08440 [Algoriphagus sanaruensis]
MKHSSFLPNSMRDLFLPAILGASLPLALLLFLILNKPGIFESWMYLPLTIIPFGGAVGGTFFYLMGFHWFPEGSKKLAALIFSTLLYFFGIWISSVMAFAITGHWN